LSTPGKSSLPAGIPFSFYRFWRRRHGITPLGFINHTNKKSGPQAALCAKSARRSESPLHYYTHGRNRILMKQARCRATLGPGSWNGNGQLALADRRHNHSPMKINSSVYYMLEMVLGVKQILEE
jgi:hypothetical protein